PVWKHFSCTLEIVRATVFHLVFHVIYLYILIVDALNAYCKVAIGKDWNQTHSTLKTRTCRRVMDFRKNNQVNRDKSFLSRLAAGTRRSLAMNTDETDNPHQIIWNTNARLNVFE